MYLYTYMYVCIFMYMYVYTYIYVCIYVYTYMCIFTQVNLEASDVHTSRGVALQRWILGQDGKKTMTHMVKCLGFALRDVQWNHVSFSPHSVICPLNNLTRTFPSSDLQLDHPLLVSHILQLMRESQRFSHWNNLMAMSIQILENISDCPSSQILMRGGGCLQLLQDVGHTNPPQSVWFPPHPSPEDQGKRSQKSAHCHM